MQRICPGREYDTFRFGVVNLKVKYMFDERLNFVSKVTQSLGQLYSFENLWICRKWVGFGPSCGTIYIPIVLYVICRCE